RRWSVSAKRGRPTSWRFRSVSTEIPASSNGRGRSSFAWPDLAENPPEGGPGSSAGAFRRPYRPSPRRHSPPGLARFPVFRYRKHTGGTTRMRHVTAATLSAILSLFLSTGAARSADTPERQFPLASSKLTLAGGTQAGARHGHFLAP